MAADKEKLSEYILTMQADNITEAFEDQVDPEKTESPVIVTAEETPLTNNEEEQQQEEEEPKEEEPKEEEKPKEQPKAEEEEKYEVAITFKEEDKGPGKIHSQPGTVDKEKRVAEVERVVSLQTDGDVLKKSQVIYRIYDRDQKVPKKVHNDKWEELNKVDPNWKYNITLGDLEFRKITHYDGTEETLWFPMEKYPDDYEPDGDEKKDDDKKKKKKGKKPVPPRKVFIALKVKRVSAVDNIAETVKFFIENIFLSWIYY